MLRLAFSTVACHTWTLERVARSAGEWGYMGVELRSFGEGGTRFACDPALTSGGKVRELFREAGVEVAGIGGGVRFDAMLAAADQALYRSKQDGRNRVTVNL